MATEQDRERLQEMRRRLAALQKVKPVNGAYRFGTENLTENAWRSEIKKAEKEIARLEKLLAPTQMEVTAAEAKTKRELAQQAQKVQLDLNSVSARRKDLEAAAKSARTVEERQNLANWVSLFKANETRLKAALTELQAGRQPKEMPSAIQLVSVDAARTQTPVGPQFTPTAPQAAGATTPAGATVGEIEPVSPQQRGEGLTPTAPRPTTPQPQAPTTTTRVPATTTTTAPAPATTTTAPGIASPGVTPAPAGQQPGGAWVTDPATGQQVYLPPNIDFAWLASQAAQTPAAWEQAAIELYGGYYEVIKNIPELRALIGRAMSGEWSEDKLQYELEQTNWWRTTTASARAWEEQKVRDPATLQTLVDNKITAIRNEALNLGLRVNDDALARLAEDSLKFGWSENVLTNAIGMEGLRSQAGVSQLRQGYYGQSVKSIAGQYGVPLSDTVTNQWVSKIATGQETIASYQAYVQDLSKNLYPALSSGFDRGLTFKQMTDPYAEVASNLLEIPTSMVDFTDPRWAAAFTMRNDKGEQMQMSFGEWADYLRTNASFGYEYTDQARNKAYQVVNDLARMFGAA